MRTQPVVPATTIAVVVLAAISCQRETPNEPGPEITLLSRIEIAGPPVVVPDSATQYRAIAQARDGSSRDITTQSQWHSSRSGVLSLTPAGIATARSMGESEITIEYLNLRAGLKVLVLTPGTYRVIGVVTESGVPIAGATVQVIENPGTTTVTDALGAYQLYGVAVDTHVRVTKDGYKPLSSSVTVGAHQTLDFALETVSPPTDVRGLYSLTLTADSCPPGVPPDERTRTYDAQVTQDGPRLTVLLSGAQFALRGERGNGFTGHIAPDGITFVLSGWDDYVYHGIYYNLVEVLADTPLKLYTAAGTVSASASPSGISGFLEGEIAAVTALGQYSNSEWWDCVSHKHRFVLQRR